MAKKDMKQEMPPPTQAQLLAYERALLHISRVKDQLAQLPAPFGFGHQFTGPGAKEKWLANGVKFVGEGRVPEGLSEVRRAIEGLCQMLDSGLVPPDFRSTTSCLAAELWASGTNIQSVLTGQHEPRMKYVRINSLLVKTLLPCLKQLESALEARCLRPPRMVVLREGTNPDNNKPVLWIGLPNPENPAEKPEEFPVDRAPAEILLALNMLGRDFKIRVQVRSMKKLWKQFSWMKPLVDGVGGESNGKRTYVAPALFNLLIDEREPASRSIKPCPIQLRSN